MFVDERFIIKALFDAGLASLRWSGPSYKRSSHDSEPQTVSETASHVSVLLVIALKCSSLFSSAHGTPPGARLFSERILKLYLL